MTTPQSDRNTVIEPSGFAPLKPAGTLKEEPSARLSNLHRRRSLIYVALAVFVIALWFLFTARSLHISVRSDTPAAHSIDGFALPLGERYLLRPGNYTVSVEAAGYRALKTDITVTRDDSQTLELVLQPLPGRISVDSVPQGALLTIDGEAVGKTPLEDFRIAPGEYKLTLGHPRYQHVEQLLSVSGRDIHQQLKLELAPAWAEMTISSQPEGAKVLIDGEAEGLTPAKLELIEGEHQITLQLNNYADWQESFQITAEQALNIGAVALLPAPGVLKLTTEPSAANVTVNGVFEGQTPLVMSLSPERTHTLSIFKAGYRRHTESLSLAAKENAQRTLKLTPQLGTVRFNVRPANAKLRINGQEHGTGSQVLSLPAVEHRIDINLAGYAPHRLSITPRPGLEQLVQVVLKTEKEAVLYRIKPTITTPLGQTLLLLDPAASTLADFTMGASRRDPGRRSNEVLRPVSLRRMFYLQTTEVTNAQFREFQEDHKSGLVEGRSLNRERQPAVQLSWQQAASFCNWLSKREGLPPFYIEDRGIISGFRESSTGYRLPTEAEWAWAARTQDDALQKFPWGNSFPPKETIENYADKDSAFVTGRVLNSYVDGYVVSAPVASFKPNSHGIHDVGGNVAEWIHDVYGIPTADGVTERDPLGAQNGDNYVIRGASWAKAKLPELRLSHRDYGQAGRDDVGFRLARYAE